jgi:hypothetical protein
MVEAQMIAERPFRAAAGLPSGPLAKPDGRNASPRAKLASYV